MIEDAFTFFLMNLVILLFAHFLGDYALQSEAMAKGKNRNNQINPSLKKQAPTWYYWMLAHAFIHGGLIWFFMSFLITNSWIFIILEVPYHFFIDTLKCDGRIDIHQDQALHVFCKILYIIFLML